MGNSFVFVDVSMEIVHGKFTSGNGSHSRISVLPPVKGFVTAVNRPCVTSSVLHLP